MARNILLTVITLLILGQTTSFAQGNTMVLLGTTSSFEKDDDNTIQHSFKFTLANIYFKGDVNKRLNYTIRADMISKPILCEAYLTFSLNKYFGFSVGQIKVPYTIEANMAPSTLEAGFDMVITKLAGYKDVCGVGGGGRDIGMSIGGSAFERESKGATFDLLRYSVGIVNGYELVSADNDDKRNYAAKIDIYPYDQYLDLSASVYRGSFTKDDISDGARNRFSVGAHYKPDDGLYLRSEFITGTTGCSPDMSGNNTFQSRGAYMTLGYIMRFKPILDGDSWRQRLLPFAKYEYFNENVAIGDKTNSFALGFDYQPYESLIFKSYYNYKWNSLSSNVSSIYTIGMTLVF